MSDQESQTPSALAHNDPADVISFYMSARESAKQRLAQTRRRPLSATEPEAQPS